MQQKGFTLIEISLVIIIIAMIIVGIVTGKNLLHRTEIVSIIREYSQFVGAISTFDLKYDAKPGDMRNAWNYLTGREDTVCGAASVGASGCNGDGNGVIGNQPSERSLAWMHLQRAGLIGDRVKVPYVAGNNNNLIPTQHGGVYIHNVPIVDAAEGDAGWGVFNPSTNTMWDDAGVPNSVFGGRTEEWLILGGYQKADPTELIEGVLRPKDARMIDEKIDGAADGMSGKVVVFTGVSASAAGVHCISGYAYDTIDTVDITINDTYQYREAEPTCVVLFSIGED